MARLLIHICVGFRLLTPSLAGCGYWSQTIAALREEIAPLEKSLDRLREEGKAIGADRRVSTWDLSDRLWHQKASQIVQQQGDLARMIMPLQEKLDRNVEQYEENCEAECTYYSLKLSLLRDDRGTIADQITEHVNQIKEHGADRKVSTWDLSDGTWVSKARALWGHRRKLHTKMKLVDEDIAYYSHQFLRKCEQDAAELPLNLNLNEMANILASLPPGPWPEASLWSETQAPSITPHGAELLSLMQINDNLTHGVSRELQAMHPQHPSVSTDSNARLSRPEHMPGFRILYMGNVPADFMNRLPLQEWVEAACSFHDLTGETEGAQMLQCVHEAPASPDARKYVYVPDAHALELVAMCNTLRAFNNFKDSEMLSVSFRKLIEARTTSGQQPRFRLAKPPSASSAAEDSQVNI